MSIYDDLQVELLIAVKALNATKQGDGRVTTAAHKVTAISEAVRSARPLPTPAPIPVPVAPPRVPRIPATLTQPGSPDLGGF